MARGPDTAIYPWIWQKYARRIISALDFRLVLCAEAVALILNNVPYRLPK